MRVAARVGSARLFDGGGANRQRAGYLTRPANQPRAQPMTGIEGVIHLQIPETIVGPFVEERAREVRV